MTADEAAELIISLWRAGASFDSIVAGLAAHRVAVRKQTAASVVRVYVERNSENRALSKGRENGRIQRGGSPPYDA